MYLCTQGQANIHAVAFLDEFEFGGCPGEVERTVLAKIGASAREIHISTRLEGVLPVVVNPQPVAAEAQWVGIGLVAADRWPAISHKDVVVETVVASRGAVEAGERGGVCFEIWRRAPG